jgi:two-component system chemotaxis response regulator CheB
MNTGLPPQPLGFPDDPSAPIMPWGCPECSGTIWRVAFGAVIQFRCRVGHAYSPDAFLEEHSATVERTLWAAIRLLEERAAIEESLAEDAVANGDPSQQRAFETSARRTRERVEAIRQVLGMT